MHELDTDTALTALLVEIKAIRELLSSPPRMLTDSELCHEFRLSRATLTRRLSAVGSTVLPGAPIYVGPGQRRWDPRTAPAWLAAAADIDSAKRKAATSPAHKPKESAPGQADASPKPKRRTKPRTTTTTDPAALARQAAQRVQPPT